MKPTPLNNAHYFGWRRRHLLKGEKELHGLHGVSIAFGGAPKFSLRLLLSETWRGGIVAAWLPGKTQSK